MCEAAVVYMERNKNRVHCVQSAYNVRVYAQPGYSANKTQRAPANGRHSVLQAARNAIRCQRMVPTSSVQQAGNTESCHSTRVGGVVCWWGNGKGQVMRVLEPGPNTKVIARSVQSSG